MEFVSGVIRIVTPASTLLCVLEVLSPPHLLTDTGATTGLAQTKVGVRGDGGVFSIREAITTV
jgi:hypothetical protein